MVNFPKIFKFDESDAPGILLPLLPLRDIVVFPHMVAPLFVGREKSVNALANAMNKDKQVFLATQKKAKIDNPNERDISMVGTIGTVLQLLKLPDGTVKALVEGKTRARIKSFVKNDEYFQVEVVPFVDEELAPAKSVALCRAIVESFEEYARLNKSISRDLVANIGGITDPSKLADTVASHFQFKIEDKQRLLEAPSIEDRLAHLLKLTKMEIEIFRTDQKIKGRVKAQMEKTQKQYYLNEQIRAIKKEMGGEEDPGG